MANAVFGVLTQPDATTTATYSAYADDISVHVTSSAKVEEISKEIGRYEALSRAKVNLDWSVRFSASSVGRW